MKTIEQKLSSAQQKLAEKSKENKILVNKERAAFHQIKNARVRMEVAEQERDLIILYLKQLVRMQDNDVVVSAEQAIELGQEEMICKYDPISKTVRIVVGDKTKEVIQAETN